MKRPYIGFNLKIRGGFKFEGQIHRLWWFWCSYFLSLYWTTGDVDGGDHRMLFNLDWHQELRRVEMARAYGGGWKMVYKMSPVFGRLYRYVPAIRPIRGAK